MLLETRWEFFQIFGFSGIGLVTLMTSHFLSWEMRRRSEGAADEEGRQGSGGPSMDAESASVAAVTDGHFVLL